MLLGSDRLKKEKATITPCFHSNYPVQLPHYYVSWDWVGFLPSCKYRTIPVQHQWQGRPFDEPEMGRMTISNIKMQEDKIETYTRAHSSRCNTPSLRSSSPSHSGTAHCLPQNRSPCPWKHTTQTQHLVPCVNAHTYSQRRTLVVSLFNLSSLSLHWRCAHFL